MTDTYTEPYDPALDEDTLLEEVEIEENVKTSKDKNEINTSYYENDKYIIEQINATDATHANSIQDATHNFIQYEKGTGKHKFVKNYKNGIKTYKPIESQLISKKSIYLSTGVEEYNSLEEIIDQIKEYYNQYFEAPEFFQEFLPYYTIFTWVYDKFPFIPYLHFVGRTSTGKSWTAETVASLCYKAIDAAGSVTIASLFRATNDWGGTIYLDEFDLKNFGSEGYTAMENFMKAGVSDRSILRVEGNNNKNMKVVPYKVKSPKIFTSETPISAAGLQSRTIVIQMEKNKRKLPLYKLSDYHEKGESIRNKLLLWRLRNLSSINLKDIEYGFQELQGLDRRVQQVLTPIYYLAGKKAKVKILEFAKKQEDETKRQRRDSEEGTIFSFIYDYWVENQKNIVLKELTDQINKQREDDGYKGKRSERKISELVRKILGFNTERQGHENKTMVLVEENMDKLEELSEYYGMAPCMDVAPVASVAKDIVDKAVDIFDE